MWQYTVQTKHGKHWRTISVGMVDLADARAFQEKCRHEARIMINGMTLEDWVSKYKSLPPGGR